MNAGQPASLFCYEPGRDALLPSLNSGSYLIVSLNERRIAKN